MKLKCIKMPQRVALKGLIGAETEKGVEVGKKLPRKFPSLAESFGANHTRNDKFCNSL